MVRRPSASSTTAAAGSPARASSAAQTGGRSAGRTRAPRRRTRVPALQPAPGVDRAVGSVFGDEVRGPLVAVDVRVRQPRAQVAQVAVGEDRVAGAPQHQHGHVGQRRETRRDAVQRRRADVLGLRAGCLRRTRRRRAAWPPCRTARRGRRARRRAAPGRERALATRTNVGVAVQIACRSAGVRASRMSDGTAASAGWWTAVLASTTARSAVAVGQRPAERDRRRPSRARPSRPVR